MTDPGRLGRRPGNQIIVAVAIAVMLMTVAGVGLARKVISAGDANSPGRTALTVGPPSPTSNGRATAPATMPDDSNTGVPPGTVLSEYAGPMTIDQPNTVIDGKTVRGILVVSAANVRITRSHIIGAVTNESAAASFSIADSTVDAGDAQLTGIGSVNFVASRVHVIGGNRSILCGQDCTVEYSYVHGQMKDETGIAHESGIRMSQRSTIRFNTIACDAPDVPPDAGCSAALTGYGDFEPVQDNLIQGNLFRHGSGGFCAYGGSSGADGAKPFGDQASGIRFIDNVWERGTRPGDKGVPTCGFWGAITDFDPARPGNQWSGNSWDDGEPLKP